MKRQRGRNRGGGNSGGKPQQQNANRAFDSNGPEGVKVRGNAQHVFEKYQQLARDAGSAGDRVLAENYLQHAEHYFRVVRAMQPQRPASEILGRDQFTSGFDIDFEDESGAQAQQIADAENANNSYNDGGEGETEARGGWRDDRPQRDDRQRDDRPRDDRPRDDRSREDRPRFRDDRPQRDDRQRDERPRDDRAQRDDRPPREDRPQRDAQPDSRPRDERPREDRPREDRPREDRPRNFEGGGRRDRFRDRDDRPPREDRPDRDPLAVVEPQSTPLVSPAPAASEERASPVLRDETGGESRAPAFLKSTPRVKPQSAPLPTVEETAASDEAAKRPKRRRAPRTFEGGAAPSESEEV